MVTIEKNVPIPISKYGHRKRVIEQMEVGDSIVTTKMESMHYYHAARRMGVRVARRKENDEYRIWRLE